MFVILIGSKWSEASEFALVKIKRRSVVNDRVNIEFRIVITVEPLLYEQ